MRVARRQDPLVGPRRVVGARAALPLHPDLHRRPVLVQRQQGPLQLHLAGLHARPLGGPVREPRPRRRAQELGADRAAGDGARDRAGDVHGAVARALRLPRPRRRRPARLPPARDPGGRARRRAARAVPDDGGQHRLRDDRDRPHDVHDLLRRRDGEGAARGHGPPHRGGGDGPRGDRVDDVPQDHAADDRARRRGGGAAGLRDLDRRLRDHELQRGPDADVPALHLRRHAPGRAARGQRAGHRAARRSC